MAQFNALKTQVAALQKKNTEVTEATGELILFDRKCVDNWKSVKEYSGYNIGTGPPLRRTATDPPSEGCSREHRIPS